MNQNETIALFMGLDIEGNQLTDGTLETNIKNLKYTTSYDWFIPAWNKAVGELGKASPLSKEWDMLFERFQKLPAKFTISTRLPILLEIIEFLDRDNPK